LIYGEFGKRDYSEAYLPFGIENPLNKNEVLEPTAFAELV
jgi:hypothetical protein